MATPKTTDDAFLHLLNRPDLWRLAGKTPIQRQRLLNKVKNGVGISVEAKEKILKEAGYTIQQVTTWNEPTR